MIIRGNPVGNVGWWTQHLQRDDTNELAEVREIRGLTGLDLKEALTEMRWVAAGSRCGPNFMYQANINPYAHEHLTPEQWSQAIDTLEKNLGLEGHQRVVVEHVKEGRQHFHIIWNRVDAETLKATDMRGNWKVHERTQAELEEAFGLTPTPPKDPNRAQIAEPWEQRAAARSGIDREQVKDELTALWRATDSGQAFKAAIEERGYVLARGDKADFCVVDHAGNAPNLVRRLDGVRTAEMRARMGDVDREALPSVADARQAQRERFAEPGKAWAERGQEAETYWERRLRTSRDARAEAERLAVKREERDDITSFWERRIEANRPEVRAREDWLPPRFEAGRDEITGRRPDSEKPPEQGRDLGAEAPRTDRTSDEAPQGARAATEAPGGLDAESGLAGAEKIGLGVASVATGGVEKLADFAANFLAGGGTAKPKPLHSGQEQVEQILARRRALDALKNIRNSIERGQNLKPEDVQNLPPETLKNIAQKGDAYLQDIIRQMDEDERRRAQERGRERER